MKSITDEMKEILQNDVINLVRCWKITLKDNNVISFTNASENFTYNNLEYTSVSADNIKDLNTNADVNQDSFKVSNFISTELISESDILSGKYDKAKVEIFIVDLQNLEKGQVSLLTGSISEIEYKNNSFIANVKGLKNEIDKVIGDVYTPLCRASFCDKKCKLNKENFTYEGSISNIINFVTFSTVDLEILDKPQGYFENGIIEFTSGDNLNQKTEIKQFNNGEFILSLELPHKINIGDIFKVVVGCDKKFKTCCEKFNNAINFRGEPHLPGIKTLLKVM